jgi:hypothetical protein
MQTKKNKTFQYLIDDKEGMKNQLIDNASRKIY